MCNLYLLLQSAHLMLLVGFVLEVTCSCLSVLGLLVGPGLLHWGWTEVDLRKFNGCFNKATLENNPAFTNVRF